MTAFLRRWRQRLTGPRGRRVLLALSLAGVWGWWMYVPPQPRQMWSVPDGFVAVSRDLSVVVTATAVMNRPGTGELVGPVRLWDMATGRERLRVLDAGTQLSRDHLLINGLVPDGSWLLTRDLRGGLTLWDTATGRPAELRPPGDPGTAHAIDELAVSPDGRVIAGERPDGRAVQLWESATGRLLATLDGARGPMVFTPDGRSLLTATPGTAAKLWDVATGRELLDLPGHPSAVGAVGVSPDGRLLATGLQPLRLPEAARTGPTVVKLWVAGTGKLIATLDVTEPLAACQLAFSPESKLFVIRSNHGHGLIWDLTIDPPQNRDDLIALTEHDFQGTAYLNSITMFFAPDDRRWWTTAENRRSLARAEPPDAAPRVIRRLGRNGHAGSNLIFSADGRAFAVLVLYEVPAFEQRVRDWVKGVLGQPVSGDTRRSTVQLFDAATGRELATLPEDGYHGFRFTPDGRALWTLRPDKSAAGNVRVLEQWVVPLPGPPWWLLTVTAIGVMSVVADWRRSRRRVATGGRAP